MARNYLTEDQYYNYPIDEAQTIFDLQNPDKEFLDFYSNKPRDLGFFPTSISQNPAMVNYGIGTLPQFDMANLPMYEKDDSEQEYIPGTDPQESGIAKLFQFLGNLPTPFSLARRGLESLQGFNQRFRDNDFARSTTGAEYFQKRRDRKAREDAAKRGADKQRIQNLRKFNENYGQYFSGGNNTPSQTTTSKSIGPGRAATSYYDL